MYQTSEPEKPLFGSQDYLLCAFMYDVCTIPKFLRKISFVRIYQLCTKKYQPTYYLLFRDLDLSTIHRHIPKQMQIAVLCMTGS